jgi:hypothetical protein
LVIADETLGLFAMDQTGQSINTEAQSAEAHRAARRNLLKLGAVGAAAVVTVRPALAQTAASVLNCEIPVPDPANSTKYVAADGTLVEPGTPGSFYGGWKFSGEEVKGALSGGSLPGAGYDQSQAYMNYIRRLQYGQSGFTCYASLQLPR